MTGLLYHVFHCEARRRLAPIPCFVIANQCRSTGVAIRPLPRSAQVGHREQVLHDELGLFLHLRVRREQIRHHDGVQAPGIGGADAVEGVLDHPAVLRRGAQKGGRGEKDLRVGLGVRHLSPPITASKQGSSPASSSSRRTVTSRVEEARARGIPASFSAAGSPARRA